ncbi:MAG TPA: RNA 2',3'-cyclic phosphodiesterase, partial [Pirellulales bacterium]
LIAELAATSANVKWVEPENLHFTLKFLGDVPLLEVPDICTALADAVSDLPPFDVQARGAGAFPTLERPRTLWLGVDGGADAMREVHAAVERGLAPYGFRREQRRFRPHLTIGRVRNSSAAGIQDLAERLAACREFIGGITDVAEVVVFASEQGRNGPKYEPLSHASLNGS